MQFACRTFLEVSVYANKTYEPYGHYKDYLRVDYCPFLVGPGTKIREFALTQKMVAIVRL